MKSIQKSVRMSDEVFKIVESIKGEGFNEKFQNLVITYKKEEKKILSNIKELEKQEKHLSERIQKTAKVLNDLERIQSGVSAVLNTYERSECNSKYLQLRLLGNDK